MKNRIIRYLLLWTAFLLGGLQSMFAGAEHDYRLPVSEQHAAVALSVKIAVALDHQTHIYESHTAVPSFRWLSSEVNFEKGETDDDYTPDTPILAAVTSPSFRCLQCHTVRVAVNNLLRHYTYPHYFSSLFIPYQSFLI